MSPTKSRKTILLAEDEHLVRTFVLDMLKDCGYDVIVAVDGLDALAKSRQHTGSIDLLLSDIQMPNMTGIELAIQIQAERPAIQVLLMSGLASGMLVLNEGWQFLPKPFMSNMLKTKVKHFLGDSPQTAQPAAADEAKLRIARLREINRAAGAPAA